MYIPGAGKMDSGISSARRRRTDGAASPPPEHGLPHGGLAQGESLPDSDPIPKQVYDSLGRGLRNQPAPLRA